MNRTGTVNGILGVAPVSSGRIAKRVVDVVLATVGLLLSAPAWVLIALAIKLEDGGLRCHGTRPSVSRCRLTKASALWYLTGPTPDSLSLGEVALSPRLVGVLGGVTERFEEVPARPAWYEPMPGPHYSVPPGAGRLIPGP